MARKEIRTITLIVDKDDLRHLIADAPHKLQRRVVHAWQIGTVIEKEAPPT